jgi:hypothetical protein
MYNTPYIKQKQQQKANYFKLSNISDNVIVYNADVSTFLKINIFVYLLHEYILNTDNAKNTKIRTSAFRRSLTYGFHFILFNYQFLPGRSSRLKKSVIAPFDEEDTICAYFPSTPLLWSGGSTKSLRRSARTSSETLNDNSFVS